MLKYEYVKPGMGSRAEELCKLLMEAPNVATDTETTGLDPHKDVVTLLSLSSRKHGTFVIDTRDVNNLKAFAPLFESEAVVKTLHNASFDYQMIKGSAGTEIERAICTMLGEQTLTVGKQYSGYALSDVVLKYLGIEMDKSVRKSFIGHTGEFSEQQLNYAGDDTALLLDVAEKMQADAKSRGLLRTWITESNAMQSFADMEFYGQKIDTDLWKRNMEQNLESAVKARKDLDVFFEPVCDRELDGSLIIDYDSPKELLFKFKELGIEVDGASIENTDKKTQKKLKELPVIAALSKYRSAMKGYGTYGDQYLLAIHPVTGRVHFRFNQYGTGTGRPACKDGLNCLNIPRDKRYRDCFITDLDRLLGTADYSGAELRIMADLSGDPLMVKGYNSKVDFHCYVAALLFNRLKVEKSDPLRTPTKTLNFGLAYGMGPGSLYDQVNGMGHPITYDDCKKLFYKYKDTFKTTIQWLESQQREASSKFRMANINGRERNWNPPDRKKVETKIREEHAVAMRKREKKGDFKSVYELSDLQIKQAVDYKVKSHLAAIQREGANFQIQSVNADMTKVAMHRMRKEFKRLGWGPNTPKGSRTYNSVYDEIVYDFHKDFAEQGFELQKKIMVDAANEMLEQVPMEVEGHLDVKWVK